jgi:hypothetical protein
LGVTKNEGAEVLPPAPALEEFLGRAYRVGRSTVRLPLRIT